jgi:site-specific recombinase XerD
VSKRAHRFASPGISIPLPELEDHARGWLLDGQIRQLSPSTLAARRFLVGKLLWFLRQQEAVACGTLELRGFLAYLSTAHESDEGRWGNTRQRNVVRPRTVQTYFVNLKTLFNYLVEEGVLEASPMETLRPPVARADQVQPFTEDQIRALLAAARRSRHPLRDHAIVLMLLDTGCRASELCALKLNDLDLQGRRCTVLGKGNKRRSLYFGRETTKALWAYLRAEPRDPEECLFAADRGQRAAEPLTRSGLLQLIRRLGKAAGIEACRCSPHTFRHTFACSFLRAGGNIFSLKELLGHTSLAMVNRYLALAQADIENQHRQFSPADRLRRR